MIGWAFVCTQMGLSLVVWSGLGMGWFVPFCGDPMMYGQSHTWTSNSLGGLEAVKLSQPGLPQKVVAQIKWEDGAISAALNLLEERFYFIYSIYIYSPSSNRGHSGWFPRKNETLEV